MQTILAEIVADLNQKWAGISRPNMVSIPHPADRVNEKRLLGV